MFGSWTHLNQWHSLMLSPSVLSRYPASETNETRASCREAAGMCVGRRLVWVGFSLSVIVPQCMGCPVVVVGEVSRAHTFEKQVGFGDLMSPPYQFTNVHM